jgi:predicted AAA+ superfamily ATPase
LKELQIGIDRDSKHGEIHYWRTSSGAEVDFVLSKKPEIYPFEVTYSHHAQEKKIKNLSQFMRDESSAKVGFYVYMGEFNYDEKNKILFLPAWAVI